MELAFGTFPKENRWGRNPYHIGYSTLMSNPGGFFVIGMTGVLRGYRGPGLARALKAAATRGLAQRGGEIRTFNDPPNVAVVIMNRALNFVRSADQVRYELKLAWAAQP